MLRAYLGSITVCIGVPHALPALLTYIAVHQAQLTVQLLSAVPDALRCMLTGQVCMGTPMHTVIEPRYAHDNILRVFFSFTPNYI